MDENNQHNRRAGHEESDINVWAVGKFAVALALVVVAVLFLLFGLFRYLLSREGGPPARTRARPKESRICSRCSHSADRSIKLKIRVRLPHHHSHNNRRSRVRCFSTKDTPNGSALRAPRQLLLHRQGLYLLRM